MNQTYRLLTAIVVILGMFALLDAAAAGKHNHHNGQQLLGEKVKTNRHHVIHQKGDYTVSVEAKNGKVAGVHVKHAKKGDVSVKKYKTNKKMAAADGLRYASYDGLIQVQQYVGTTYIGYAYVDEYGDEEIYWFPYDMILNGDTGAIEYVPAY